MRHVIAIAVVFALAALVFAQPAEQPAEPPPARPRVVIDRLPFVCDKPGTTYVMQQDLSCPDSGIFIQASDVVIDLGGRTLTWGTGQKVNDKALTYNSLQSGNVGHHAIYVTSDPRASKDAPVPAGWNPRLTGVVIRNGTVKSGAGGISYSDAIMVTGTVGCEIADLTVETDAADSSAIITGPNAKVHDCRIVHNGTVVSNRHQQLAVIVSGPGSEVFNCTLLGGPQVGIKALDGSHIHHNEIRHNAVVTNCYGILGYGQKDLVIDHNLVIAKNGRGIHCSEKSSGWDVHDNYVEVRETANREYPKGMQTHGIKMEGCRDTKVHHNVVLSVSVPGGHPTPLNMDVPENSNNEVFSNVFIARKETPKEHATALYLVAGDGRGTKVHDNIFFTNDRVFECIWDAPTNYSFSNNRFYRLSPEDKITTFYFWNAKPVGGFVFRDCLFGPGVSPTAWEFPDTKEDWPRDAEFRMEWTMKLKVLSEGRPVAGAKVEAASTQEELREPLILTTDADGTASVTATQFQVAFSGQTRKTSVAKLMPYLVKVNAGEAGSYKFEVTIDKTSDVTVDLKAQKHVVTPRKDEPAPDVDKLIAAAKAAAGPGGK